MGTRTSGFVDYNLPNNIRAAPDLAASILDASSPACLEVQQYWPAHDPDETESWRMEERGADGLVGSWFGGPGSMVVRFGLRVAEIHAGVRWRGLLTIPALRQVHRAAFSSIARAIGATGIIFVPDYADELTVAMDDGKTFDECLVTIEAAWGPLQGDLDEISRHVIAECEHCPPRVWYLEHL